MPLVSGTHLGSYELLAPLGAGGMGEVYRGRDLRLGREVAIKVLPATFAEAAERRQRFEHEARVLAALNAPSIVQVFEAGVHEGMPFLVMELLEGETLRTRIHGRPLPTRRAAEITLEIARGLSSAHEKGILHRDLKPENIFLLRDGRVKVLDFGLAKAHFQAPGPAQEILPTETFSDPGHIVGTSGYMSPEQVQGEALDPRSDLFSLGVLLFEMLTGQHPFARGSALETMFAILKEDPPELNPTLKIPPELERILTSCLAKAPQGRFHSAHDLAFALEGLHASSTSTGIERLHRVPRKGLWAGLSVGALLLAVMLPWTPPPREAALPTFRQLTAYARETYNARFTPDGREILFDASESGAPPRLMTMPLETREERTVGSGRLLGVSSRGEAALSLNPERDLPITHWFRGTLGVAPSMGVAPKLLAPDIVFSDLSPTGERAVVRYLDGRFRLECPVGKVLHDRGTTLAYPRFSPDGRHLAFMERWESFFNSGQIRLLDLARGSIRSLTGVTRIHGLAWRGDEIWYAPANANGSSELRAVNLNGQTRRILPLAGEWGVHDAHPTGPLLMAHVSYQIRIWTWTGSVTSGDLSRWGEGCLCGLTATANHLVFLEMSEIHPLGFASYLRPLRGGPPSVLGYGSYLSISPDGTRIASIQQAKPPEVAVLPTGPSGEEQRRSFPTLDGIGMVSWAADGASLLVSGHAKDRPPRIWRVSLKDGALVPISPEGVSSGFDFMRPSPDGRWLIAEAGNTAVLCDLAHPGSAPRPIPGLERGESTAGWTQDSRAIYALRQGPLPRLVTRVDIHTGRRQAWRTLDAPGMKGHWLTNPFISLDGRVAAANLFSAPSQLYILEGVR